MNHAVQCPRAVRKRLDRIARAALSVLAATLALATPYALAQDSYPSRPVKLLVGFAPGGAPDTIAREVANGLSQLWGRQVVVDNKPGAGGAIAADLAARAAPDGYTLFLTSDAALVSVPFMNERTPYDPLADLTPIGMVSGFPLVLVASPSLKVKTFGELVAAANAVPGAIAYASTGVGTSSHLPMERLQRAAGIQLNHVTYKGGPQALTDLMAGEAPLMLNTVAMTAQHIQAGKLVLLAVGSLQRLSQFPNTPTVAELGFPGFEAGNWIGLVGPARLPDAIVQKVQADMHKVAQSPAYRERMTTLGFEVRTGTSDEFARQIRTDHARNKALFGTLDLKKN
jgi:tripartite-type tricarboxylate transporter receptor subunit TctC